MKPLPVFLVVSLIANIGLGAYAWRIRAGNTTGQAPAVAGSIAATHSAIAATAKTDARSAWERVAARDLPELVGELRAAGLPAHLLRVIVSTEIYHRMAPRRSALLAETPVGNYWETGRYSILDPKLNIALRRLHREHQEQLRQLLGPDATAPDELTRESQRRRYGPLSSDDIDELEQISADYEDLRMETQMTTNGVYLPEDREKLGFLDREEQTDLAAVLGAQELLEYELRQSATARKMRRMLVGFNASEEEFRQIFSAFRALEAGNISNNYGATMFNTSDAERAAVRAQLAGQLAPERLADLDQAMDPQYAAMNRIVSRLQLPLSAAREVTAARDDFTARAAALRHNRDLTDAERSARLTALQNEAIATVTRTLGDQGIEMYRSFGGNWLNLSPQPPPRTN